MSVIDKAVVTVLRAGQSHGGTLRPLVRSLIVPVLAVVVLVLVTGAVAKPAHCSRACVQRVIERDRADRLKREAVELAGYHRSPMPRCTWWNESGPGLPQWSPRRYRALNTSSAAGGKFQFLPSTFHSIGGKGAPHLARPVIQERLARRLMRSQGLRPWVNC